MRRFLVDSLIIGFWTLLGVVCVLGWLAPDGCPASDVIFHPSACEG